MRFDLEYISVGGLTKEKLSEFSDILYGENATISPMLWDTKYASSIVNRGDINTANFSNFNREVDNFFVSGLVPTSTISLNSIIKKDGTVTLLFNGGDFLTYRRKSSWSNNTISSLLDFDQISGYYTLKLDNDTDLSSIYICTLSVLDQKYFQLKKEFIFVEYDGISIVSTFNSSDKKMDYIYTIKDNILYLSSNKIEYTMSLGTYLSGNAIFYLPEFPAKDILINGFNDTDYKVESGAIIFNNYKENKIRPGTEVNISYSVAPIITFKQAGRSNKEDIIFKNVNVSPRSLNFKSGTIGLYNCFSKNIEPINITFSKNIPSQIGYKDTIKITATLRGIDNMPVQLISKSGKSITLNIISDNAKWQETDTAEFISDTGIDGSLSATLGIDKEKVGFYIQKEWVSNIDGRGTITIPYTFPMHGTSTTGYGQDDLKKIYLYTIYNNDPILGKIAYKDLETPIIEYTTYIPSIGDTEKEIQENTLNSYYLNGKKVAYVKLLQSSNPSNTLTSLFVKPTKVEIKNDIPFFYRELFIKSKNITIKVRGTDGNCYKCIRLHRSSYGNRPAIGPHWQNFWELDTSYKPIVNWELNKRYFVSEQFIGVVSSQMDTSTEISRDTTIVTDGRYKTGVLPDDILKIMSTSAKTATVITYNDPLPTSDPDVIGYWMVTDRTIQIQAEYNDEYIRVLSDILEINMQSLQSETAFTLTGIDTPQASSSISEFGYLSISDYIKSPFKLNSCSFYCINSDAVNKKCIHKNLSYRNNFLLDDGGIGCSRTIDYQLAHPEIGECPGLNAKLVNPFILPVIPG